MNHHNPSNARTRAVVGAGLAALMALAVSMPLRSEDAKPDPAARKPEAAAPPALTNSVAKPTQTGKPKAVAGDKKAKAATAKLSGAALYSMHCNRCHPERYPNERTAAQWKTIVLHMRVRANLPAEQAKTLLTFMQENSGY
jgi:hypothetical protein